MSQSWLSGFFESWKVRAGVAGTIYTKRQYLAVDPTTLLLVDDPTNDALKISAIGSNRITPWDASHLYAYSFSGTSLVMTNEGSGGTSTITINNGVTPANSADFATLGDKGPAGDCFFFSRSNAQGSNSSGTLFTNPGVTALSVEAFVCLYTTTSPCLLLGKENCWGLTTLGSGPTVRFTVWIAGNPVTLDALLTPGVWYHIMGTHNFTTGKMCLYVNGVLAFTKVSAGAVSTNVASSIIAGAGIFNASAVSNYCWEQRAAFSNIERPQSYARGVWKTAMGW